MTSYISINAIQQRMAEGVPVGRADEPTVRRLWWGALETLQGEIFAEINFTKGLWLASPLPALYEPRLLDRLQGWVWAPDELEKLHIQNAGFLPPSRGEAISKSNTSHAGSYTRLPLHPSDGHDPLLIIITPEVQVALALQGPPGKRNLLMRSDQETLSDLLRMLYLRLNNETSNQAIELRKALIDLGELQSNESIEKIFWPLLSQRLAEMTPSFTLQPLNRPKEDTLGDESNNEITLLEALTHEVRTPLATIRTLIRSLLKQKNLSKLVIERLKQIDSECTEQIDRFGLIFNAAELQRKQPESSRLASTDLGHMLEMLYPIWIKQLDRRGIRLHLDITPDLPPVLSNPERLELILGGLIDRHTRGLSPGGVLLLELRPAGHRIKLQILGKSQSLNEKEILGIEPNSDLGPVLSWNPSTGSLQLTQAATQQLFASLGGRLTRRRDSGLTVFFPITDVKS